MKSITQKVVDFISDLTPHNTGFIDLTWFNQYKNSINVDSYNLIVAVDVADQIAIPLGIIEH